MSELYMITLEGNPEKVFSGPTKAALVVGMKKVAFYQSDKSFDEFVDWFVSDVQAQTGITIDVPPGPAETRATALTDGLVANDLAHWGGPSVPEIPE